MLELYYITLSRLSADGVEKRKLAFSQKQLEIAYYLHKAFTTLMVALTHAMQWNGQFSSCTHQLSDDSDAEKMEKMLVEVRKMRGKKAEEALKEVVRILEKCAPGWLVN